jgi:hypothetical protein
LITFVDEFLFFIDSSHDFTNDSHHAKPTSISDEDGK